MSGNAEHVYKNRVLHHGTLLFNADLAALGHAIRVVPGAYQGKAVQSNRSTVANIAEFLPAVMTTGEFIAHLLHSRLRQDPESLMAELPHAEQREISRLAEEKFHTREWTFFYSPAYVFTRTTSLPAGEITVHLQVEKGMITAAHLEAPFLHWRPGVRWPGLSQASPTFMKRWPTPLPDAALPPTMISSMLFSDSRQ